MCGYQYGDTKWYRETLRDTERHSETQKDTEKHRKTEMQINKHFQKSTKYYPLIKTWNLQEKKIYIETFQLSLLHQLTYRVNIFFVNYFLSSHKNKIKFNLIISTKKCNVFIWYFLNFKLSRHTRYYLEGN